MSRGEDSGFLSETPTRLKIDLSGSWGYEIEGGPSGSVKNPSAYDFVGRVAFTRKFEITSEQLDRFDFHFVMLGSNYNTEISLNGDFITNHTGGYTSFVVPIQNGVLQVGNENVARVVTNNELDARKTLPLRSLVWGWRNYGGILRDVYLLGTPKLYVKDAVVQSQVSADFESAEVSVVGSIEGPEPDPAVEGQTSKKSTPGFYFEMFDKISGFSIGQSSMVPLVREGDAWKQLRATVKVSSPKLWSPDFPELYLVKCFIVNVAGTGKDKQTGIIDQYDLNYGIRDVQIRNSNIFLNGKRLVLKGVIWQEDHPTWGSAMTNEALEKDVVLIKNLGANAVRLGSHSPHPYMLNLCDRYGLFALEELPLTNVPASILLQEDYADLASIMMKEMIVRDRNHPSVLAWGIGDQFESSNPAVRGFVKSMVDVAKSFDSRPVYYASLNTIKDACTDLVDFAAVNISTQDPKLFKSQLQEWKTGNPDKPVFIAKFGTEVQPNNRSGYSDPFSYEAQARFYIQRFEAIKSVDYDGAFVWSLNDWKGDRPALTVNSGDPWMHTMGLVSADREKRLAYEAVRSVYRAEKFVALPIGNYTASAPIIYVLSGLVVLIGVVYFYNASRRFRENLNRAVMNSYNFFSDVRDQRVVSVIHSTVLGLIVSVAAAIVVSSILYHFRHNVVLDNLLSYFLVYDNLKEAVVYLIWDPLKCIAYLSIVFFCGLLLVTACLMLVSPIFKSRIYPFHAYAIAMWSTPPLLALVPIGMILFRVMESSVYVIPALVIVAALFVWVLLRLLKGMAIIFDAFAPKVYVLGLLSVAALLAVAYVYYDYTQSASIYLTFIYNTMRGS
ncbi:MAG: glycoside hydrolase family 2 protein [Bacteroidota bacterium]